MDSKKWQGAREQGAGSREPDNLSDIWIIVTFKLPLHIIN